jgi:rubrerythrin
VGRTPGKTAKAAVRRLIEAAMDLERRSMQLYCAFETQFGKPEELRSFWFDMAQHESRHFGALALVAGLLDSAPERSLGSVLTLPQARIRHLRKLLSKAQDEAAGGVTLERAFEIALEVEDSEIEDVVLDLLRALKGEAERERAVKLLIHDLGDLSYMIEKYTRNRLLLERADHLVERQVGELHQRQAHAPAKKRTQGPLRSVTRRTS